MSNTGSDEPRRRGIVFHEPPPLPEVDHDGRHAMARFVKRHSQNHVREAAIVSRAGAKPDAGVHRSAGNVNVVLDLRQIGAEWREFMNA